MRIFVTGASGFVGRAFCAAASGRGHEILGLCRSAGVRLPGGCRVAVGSLEQMSWEQVERFRPEAVLHLAWLTTPGVYLSSPQNAVLVEQSRTLFRGLSELGVRHLAGVGTCIEYAASDRLLHETHSPLRPLFAYSKAKVELSAWLRDWCAEKTVPWTWFRIFYPYGPGEDPRRLTSCLFEHLRQGSRMTLQTPGSVKDYIYITDLAEALCMALEKRLTGPVNLGSGQGVAIQELAKLMAELAGADPRLIEPAIPPPHDPNPNVVADISKILSTGWTPQTSLRFGLDEFIASARHEPAAAHE